jgi:uncharacterized protein (DUF2249 family)
MYLRYVSPFFSHYQFEAEQTGKCERHDEERGPRDWKVKIARV